MARWVAGWLWLGGSGWVLFRLYSGQSQTQICGCAKRPNAVDYSNSRQSSLFINRTTQTYAGAILRYSRPAAGPSIHHRLAGPDQGQAGVIICVCRGWPNAIFFAPSRGRGTQKAMNILSPTRFAFHFKAVCVSNLWRIYRPSRLTVQRCCNTIVVLVKYV